MQENYNPQYLPGQGGKVLFKLNRYRGKINETDGDTLIERILLNDRVINIFAKDGRLDVYARRYSTGGSEGKVIHYSARLRPGMNREEILEETREKILSRMSELEMADRDREFNTQVADYLRGYSPRTEKVLKWQVITRSKTTGEEVKDKDEKEGEKTGGSQKEPQRVVKPEQLKLVKLEEKMESEDPLEGLKVRVKG